MRIFLLTFRIFIGSIYSWPVWVVFMLKMVNTPFSHLVYIFFLIFTGIAHGGGGGGVGTQRPLFGHCQVGSLTGAQLSNDNTSVPR